MFCFVVSVPLGTFHPQPNKISMWSDLVTAGCSTVQYCIALTKEKHMSNLDPT